MVPAQGENPVVRNKRAQGRDLPGAWCHKALILRKLRSSAAMVDTAGDVFVPSARQMDIPARIQSRPLLPIGGGKRSLHA